MAEYDYQCGCGNRFTVCKTISDIERLESCESCGMILDGSHRLISRVYFSGEKPHEAYFCPGLGTVVKSKEHRRQLAKQKGLEELGNEPVENLEKIFEGDRQRRAQARWDSLTAPIEVSTGCQSNSSYTNMTEQME